MYIIKKTQNNITAINDEAWERANVAPITINNWKGYDYVPDTSAKFLYNSYGIYVQMTTNEKPLLARYTGQNDPVCKDSCMELFIRPHENDKRYLNFEFNPFGTMYLAVRTTRDDPEYPDEDKKYFEVKSYIDDGIWIHQFVIPFEFIDRIYGTHTKRMYGNLYKCGEDTPKEHYISYYPLGSNIEDFHRPDFFGEFVLE